MKKAFAIYFEKLNKVNYKEFKTYPTVAYTDMLNKDLLIGEPDEDGYIQWQAKIQTQQVDFKSIEMKLGFKLCNEIKDYYSSYLFLLMRGDIRNRDLRFFPIDSEENVENLMLSAHKNGEKYFPGCQMFMIGIANIDGDDSYMLFYNNETEKLFCYADETKLIKRFRNSLTKVIETIKPY